MLTELLQELRNWFEMSRYYGKFVIEDGHIALGDGITLADGQHYRVIGSIFNDGVHSTTDTLEDETFEGAVWALAIPQAVLDLADRIDDWMDKYGSADSIAMSPYQSESFGGYSYTKAGSSTGGATATWKSVFADELNRWRKI